jgi:TfoX/Sxy family transcriptional regulator of competence genes
MAYDEGLAERVRGVLEDQPGLTEKKMFGGICFLLDGKMCCGVMKDALLARVGAEQTAKALKQKHTRPMDFTGRPLKGFVLVDPEGLDFDKQLEGWVAQGVAIARAAKPARRPRKR